MTRKVLLIDYEPQSAERVRGVLREPEYEVVAAHDGEEALSAFSSSRFDLVLLSGLLPRLPSAEVIREIRRRGGALAPPILLIVSGYKGSNSKADAQRVGAFDLLCRPFSDETLREAAAGAIATSDAAARAAPSAAHGSSASLTASDIFSDILEEVGREPSGPGPSARAAKVTEEEVEKRLRDTLSGVLPKTGAGRPKAPPPRPSTSEDVDRLISETLSGLRAPRPRPAPAPAPATALEPPPTLPAQPASPPAPEGDRFGQYEILERIASGGMAELFRARFRGVEGFQKIVAVKKILPHIAGDEEFITMFADEAKLAAQLNHPNIVHIYDLGKIEAGGYFIAMEFVEGRDLRSILHLARDTGLRMPVPLAVSIASKVAAALDYAHRRRGDDGRELHIVHRDVSPPNILVSTDGDIKLCDFGIAHAASKVSKTDSGALKGKVRYMSPEQAWGRSVDQRSDIYSLGSVLFELLAGRKLFRGDSDIIVLEKVRAGEVVAPSSLNPEVPPALDAAVLKALAREPGERYAAVSELLRDLETVLRTYEPPPTSADLAVYVRHLEAEESALREARAREAKAPAPPPPPPKAKGGKPLSVPPPPQPEPSPKFIVEPAPPPAPGGIFAATFPQTPAGSDSKKRTRLYVMIAAAVVILAAAAWLVARKPAAAPAVAAAATPPPITPVVIVSEPTPLPTAPPVVDAKAAQAEAQRQLLARRRETPKALDGRRAAVPAAGDVAPSSAPVAMAATAAPAPSPEAKVAVEAPPARVEPTAAPTVVEAPPAAPPPAPAGRSDVPAEVSRGDLVGPGPGVVEPALLSSPRVSYPAAARQQRITGRVVVLVLVNEEGVVSEARLQQGVGGASGINEAVVDGIRHFKFRAATKNGVPVKMWRAVVVDVKP